MNQRDGRSTVDFNIHGLLTLRFVEPSTSVIASYGDRLRPALQPAGDHQADIVVAFQDEIETSGLQYVGLNKAGFDDDAFYLLDEVSGAVNARIPFETIGGRCEILCRRGVKTVPLLTDIMLLTFLSKNYVPLHASAVVYEGAGQLFMGWAKGGKTGAMLSFMNHGAEFIGDEWILLSDDGRQMLGLPNPVSLSEWQFDHIPELRPEVSTGQRFFFMIVHALGSLLATVKRSPFKKSYFAKMLGKAAPPLRRQLKVSKSPHKLFKGQIDSLRGAPDSIYWIVSHSAAGTTIEPHDPQEVAGRMAEANEYEQRSFFELYRAFKYAFPCKKNSFLERAGAVQYSLLIKALAGKDVFKVRHPYAGPLEQLFNQLRSYRSNGSFDGQF
ncbi:MAG: hypothetical protein JSW55_03555 [Chloroflexota bacterium]|nr:MAG: hypothetical protein JSW55_03555 [Chloroflexota bacterium]